MNPKRIRGAQVMLNCLSPQWLPSPTLVVRLDVELLKGGCASNTLRETLMTKYGRPDT